MENLMTTLTDNCGHHCGTVTAGNVTHTRHCNCPECHNEKWYLGGQWTPETGFQPLDKVSAYPKGIGKE